RLIASHTSTGAECKFNYDGRGRLLQQTLPDGRVETFTYDEQGNRSSVVESGGLETHYKYTPSGFISEIRCGANQASYEYDALGNCCVAETDNHRVERVFGSEDLLLRETQDDFIIEYEYNTVGLVTSRKDSTGRITKYRYNVRGKLIEIEDTMGGTHRFEYNEAGQKSCHILPNGIRRQYFYNKADSVSRVVTTGPNGNLLKERQYRYTPTGEIAQAETKGDELRIFEYDAVYQLLRTSAEGDDETFQYDLNGNIIRSSEHGSFKYEGLRLRAAGPFRYDYDRAGRVVVHAKEKGTAQYTHGLGGLIHKVTLSDGSVYYYEYDGFGRRLVKRGLDLFIRYYWDKNVLLMETRTTSSESITLLYSFFPESFRPLGHALNGQAFYYDLDQRSLVREVYGQNGVEVARYQYRAFGKRSVLALLHKEADSPFRLLGQIEDSETGLHYNRFRYYDPEVGRFISPDLYAHEVHHNPYAYGPNPISWADPFGLMPAFSRADKDAWKEENKELNGGLYTCENCGFQHTEKVFARTAETGKEVGDGSFHQDHVTP
ncbi:MAG: hypothetical protein MN733_18355, partial [Nitrososphaera sp.]|nr:hypothetical protein [Nitrososphaera sp.]